VRLLIICISILFSGCSAAKKLTIEDSRLNRSPEFRREINELLSADAENKKWERIYLTEITIAQKNDDMDAYKFFFKEYINIPRLRLPDWMKLEPQYVPKISIEDLEKL